MLRVLGTLVCLSQSLKIELMGSEVSRLFFYKDIYNEESLGKMGLNERQIRAVLYVKKKGKITNKEYRILNNISDEGARLDLMDLVHKNILKMEGKGRTVSYKLK